MCDNESPESVKLLESESEKAKKEIEEKNTVLEKHLYCALKAMEAKLEEVKTFSEYVENKLEKKVESEIES